ncbi:MAG: hypothetical protein U9N59_16340 [Campylobacterota bacterium]|nr:hypothetical protein [Campylobacterota bacterium]
MNKDTRVKIEELDLTYFTFDKETRTFISSINSSQYVKELVNIVKILNNLEVKYTISNDNHIKLT